MRYMTAGESHGKLLTAIVTAFPAGVPINIDQINEELSRRQSGYGRSERQVLEKDRVDITTGIWRGSTTGAPITFTVYNRDNSLDERDDLHNPRPGHADLAGAMKFRIPVRPILERASARETAVVVAVGAFMKQFLALFEIDVLSYVISLGPHSLRHPHVESLTPQEIREKRAASEVLSLMAERDHLAKAEIDQCREEGDSLGGIAETRAFGLPYGLGSHTQWDEKLDGILAQAVMSIQSVKGVEIGMGFAAANLCGSSVHDPIMFETTKRKQRHRGFVRPTNNAGGIEGGMSNAMPLVLRAAFKPLPTMGQPMPSIDLLTHQPMSSFYERSDICAVPAASVVMESVVATTLTRALIRKFSGDSLEEIRYQFRLSVEECISDEVATKYRDIRAE